MITGITIENFKGIRDPIRIELQPITLLFGANSAGKSTILHALHYIREVFDRHNLDADQTISGGKYVDLGGFAQFVHRPPDSNELLGDRDVTMRIDLFLTDTYPADDEPEYTAISEYFGFDLYSFFQWSDGTERPAAVELKIAWSRLEERAYVRSTTVEIDGEFFAEIQAASNLKDVFFRPNLKHSSLYRACQIDSTGDIISYHYEDTDETLPEILASFCGNVISPGDGIRYAVASTRGALPRLNRPVEFVFEQVAVAPPPPQSTEEMKKEQESKAVEARTKLAVAKELTEGLSALMRVPCKLVNEYLNGLRYLGPLRETPSRRFQPAKYPDQSRWASGLGAWDELETIAEDKLLEISGWLEDKDNLNSGYRIERRSSIEIDLADPVFKDLLTGRAFDEVDSNSRLSLEHYPTNTRIVLAPRFSDIELRPHDVGIGISQVIPVIVAALTSYGHLIAIEQPELHLHPRLQAAIADLFIEAIVKNKHRFIIETHSEHFILRLLRRIRETENGKAPADRQLRTDELTIYYLDQHDGGSRARRIDVDVKGEFIQPWPDDFFEIDFYERFPDAR